MKNEIHNNIEKILNVLLEKIGDMNSTIRESAERAYLSMCANSLIGCNSIVLHITKNNVKSKTDHSVRHIIGLKFKTIYI